MWQFSATLEHLKWVKFITFSFAIYKIVSIQIRCMSDVKELGHTSILNTAHFLECFLHLNKLHTAFFEKLSINIWSCWIIKALLSIIYNTQIISCKIHHHPFQGCFRTWVLCSFTSTKACNCHTWVVSAQPNCHFSNTCAQNFLCMSGYFSFLPWNCH
jgi:hypothetical protein